MSNATLYLHPEGYNTATQTLMGRHSAGESFLRGYLRHADVERYHFWNVAGRPQAELDALLERIQVPDKPVDWVDMRNRRKFDRTGVLNMPIPDINKEAWHRRPFGERTYAICGITHTTATAYVMGVVADLIVSPTESYDCLICTSSAVREAIETQMDAVRDYLAYQFGPRRAPELQRTTIPLGVNVDDFATSEASRKAWRETLDIPEDAVVALYVGRFNLYGKMNPALMALALEAAAQKTDKPIYWVNSGWGDSKADEATYHDGARALCPSVQYRAIDGREPGTRFSIWSVGDFFISFSDNIQETFGLTPVEAMAAGLPCVVTDWDGYKDTVRHGLDGFRVPTIAPRPGQGYDLAFRYSNSWISYDNYVGGASQFTAIDYAEAAAAIGALVNNPDYRRKLGAQAKAHARAMFDWAAIIPQYQALWGELNARRLAAPPHEARPTTIEENPWRLDPFRLFANYPTEHLTPQTVVRLAPGMTWALAQPLLTGPLATVSTYTHPTTAEVEQIVAFLAARSLASVEEVMAAFPAARRYFLERSLLWLARFGVLLIEPGERSIV